MLACGGKMIGKPPSLAAQNLQMSSIVVAVITTARFLEIYYYYYNCVK